MNDSDIAIAVAFRIFLHRCGKGQKDIAFEIGLTRSGLSKVLNFKQGLTFLQVHLFCLKYGFDISEVSKLVVKISLDKNLLKSIRHYLENKKRASISMNGLLNSLLDQI